MSIYAGCWVERGEDGKWRVCWPDATTLESGLPSRNAAEKALMFYRDAYRAIEAQEGRK